MHTTKVKSFKAITKVNELKSGLYIRALVSLTGSYTFYTVKIVGKPYKKYFTSFEEKMWVFDTPDKNTINFCNDLIGHDKTTILFPYSSKLYEQLSKMDRFQFIEFALKRKLNDFEKAGFVLDWESEQEFDNMFSDMFD